MSGDAARALLAELAALDVRFEVTDGRLRYSAPKGVLTPDRLARLRACRDDLVGLLDGHGAGGADAAPIPVQPRGRGLPLSSAQRRMWFLHELEAGGASYNMPPVVLRLDGDLDVDALRRGLDALVQRHEVLRSGFRVEAGEPLQVPLDDVAVALPVCDLSRLAPAAQQEALDRLVGAQAERPFDLRGGELLLRADLARLGPQAHIFALTLHHIVADGWSIGVLVREIGAIYDAFAAGHPVDLPPLPIQYADYAVWERGWLAGPRSDGQRAFWRQRLAGAPDVLELPTDRPRPKALRHRGHTEILRFPPAFQAPLRAFCAGAGVTPYMALLAAFAAMTSKYRIPG